jgi:hypothetical protein
MNLYGGGIYHIIIWVQKLLYEVIQYSIFTQGVKKNSGGGDAI